MHVRSARILSAALGCCAGAALLAATAVEAGPAPVCGAPATGRQIPLTSDCLFILRVAVNLDTCSPDCICAPKGSLPTSVSDALLCLNSATGQEVTFDCPCSITTSTSSTSTSTTLGGGGGSCSGGDPALLQNSVGACTAVYGQTIQPSFFPGVPGLDVTTFSGGAAFVRVDSTDPGPDPNIEEQVFGDCTVFIGEIIDGEPPTEPPFEILDPGDPGEMSNDSVTVELERGESGAFTAAPDLLPLGFNAGQEVTFAFPGGSDINSFEECVDVPEAIDITSPDLTAADFEIVPGQPLELVWQAAPDQDGLLFVTIAAVTTNFGFIGTGGFSGDAVSIVCLFDDASGEGTVAGGATALLPGEAPLGASLTTTILLSRENYNFVDVRGGGVGRNDNVALLGSASFIRTLTAFDIDLPIASLPVRD